MPMAASSGAERHAAGTQKDRERTHAERKASEHRSPFMSKTHVIADAGYMSGNPYPGYRGPTGTRNPNTRPEPPSKMPAERVYSPSDQPRKSIWERVFQPRRTLTPTPEYDLTPQNVIEALRFAPMSAAGIAKAFGAIAGVKSLQPEFTGYRGMVQGPGFYDNRDKNFAGDVQAIGGLYDYAFRFYNSLPR